MEKLRVLIQFTVLKTNSHRQVSERPNLIRKDCLRKQNHKMKSRLRHQRIQR